MVTWRLWQHLKTPTVHHPIHRQIIALPTKPTPIIISILMLLAAPVLLIPLMLLLSTGYSLVWALGISELICTEQRKQRYDLLCLTPPGKAQIHLMICRARLHRHQAFSRLNSGGTWLARALLGGLLLVSFGLSQPFFVDNPQTTGLEFIVIAAAAILLYIDHHQTVVMGCLIGMITPFYTNGLLNTRIFSPGIFAALTVMLYMVLWLVNSTLLPALLGADNLSIPTYFILWLSLCVIVFGTLREATNIALYRLLLHHSGEAFTS